jgi:8-oxo-dGTP pyrophosphatase MutT (NUDIX family)
MNKHINCNNCGKQGHLFHQCKIPITSYGIIVFRINQQKQIQFLMIRRKDSFGYIDFVRGKYNTQNKEQLQKIFNEMTIDEKNFIKNNDFITLWENMWEETANLYQYKNEEVISKKKFDLIKNGITNNDDIIMLDKLIEDSNTSWSEPEWEFPKGRRNYQEKDLDCAIREFEEETGYSIKNVNIIENIIPFEEIFIGSNHKSYKHKYYLGYMHDKTDCLPNFQKSEVSKLEWKTIEECLESIRPYNFEKNHLIQNINSILQQFRLYS